MSQQSIRKNLKKSPVFLFVEMLGSVLFHIVVAIALIFSVVYSEASPELAQAETQDQTKTLDEYWKESGLSFEYIKKSEVNNSICKSNMLTEGRIFFGCMHGLNLAFDVVYPDDTERVRVFAPQGYHNIIAKSGYDAKLLSVIGASKKIPVEVIQVSIDDEYKFQNQRAKLLRKAYELWQAEIRAYNDSLSMSPEAQVKFNSLAWEYPVDIAKVVEYLEALVTSENEIMASSAILDGKAVMEFHDHSAFLPYAYLTRNLEHDRAEYFGLGVNYSRHESRGFFVNKIVQGGPLDLQTDLKAGDQIIGFADEEYGKIENWSKATLGASMENSVQKTYEMRILRDGQEHRFDVTSGKVSHLYISDYLIEEGGTSIGYIGIQTFNSKLICEKVKEIIKAQISDGAKSFILDLRENTGGLIDQAECIAGLFLPQKTQVVYLKSIDNSAVLEEYEAGGGEYFKQPLAILINGGSFSASEVVAGALAVSRRALLIGDTSGGKGTTLDAYQVSHRLSGLARIETSARFFFSNDTTNHYYGIKPHYVVVGRQSKYINYNRLRELSINPVEAFGQPMKLELDKGIEDCMSKEPVSIGTTSETIDRYFSVDRQMLKALDMSYCQVSSAMSWKQLLK